MNCLFLDDSTARHKIFEETFKNLDITHAWSVDEAFYYIREKEIFDSWFLDHDLGVTSADGSAFVLAMTKDTKLQKKIPRKIILHSVNRDGAISMERLLQQVKPKETRIEIIPFINLI